MKMRIERTKVFDKVHIIATSFESYNSEWCNCLYVTFNKKDFLDLKYPELKENPYLKGDSFNYYDCDLAELDWHGGITYYSEIKNMADENIVVKAGCDFQHLGDDHWREADNGEKILKIYADDLYNQFMALVNK